MRTLINKMSAFLADEQGAETVEWVMIAAVLSGIIAIAFWQTLAKGVNDTIGAITGFMSDVLTAADTSGS